MGRARHIVALLAALVLVALGICMIGPAQLGSKPTPTPPESKALKVPGPRFEVMADHATDCIDLTKFPNYKPEDNANCIIGHSDIWDINIIHDKISGAEFICASRDHVLSCFTTGRNWK
jgi:hypothetical protein